MSQPQPPQPNDPRQGVPNAGAAPGQQQIPQAQQPQRVQQFAGQPRNPYTGQQPGHPPFAQPQPPAAPPRTPMNPRTKFFVTWGAITALLFVTVLAAVGTLNRDVYGAGAFVGQYLGKLQAQDASAALAMPGVELDTKELKAAGLPEGSSSALLRSAALAELSAITLVSDEDMGDGVHEVTYSYESDGEYGESTFVVKSAGLRFPLIPSWTFEESPIAVVNLQVEHTTSFTTNGFALDTRSISPNDQEPAFDNIVNVQVFTPGNYTFTTKTELLTSERESVMVDVPTQVHEATITAEPNDDFLSTAQDAVNAQLDECATQTVLQPTGCPFGVIIDDRISGDPAWSIDSYPEVTVTAGESAWRIEDVAGTAHITVDVQSLYDGTIKTLDENVSFTMRGSLYVMSDGTITALLDGESAEE